MPPFSRTDKSRNADPDVEKSDRVPDHFFEQWLGYLRQGRALAESTIEVYGLWGQRLLDRVDRIEDLSGEVLDGLLKSAFYAQLSTSSRRKALTAARSLGRYAVMMGRLPADPFLGVEGPRVYTREADTFSQAEIRRLIYGPRPGALPVDPVRARDRVILVLMYWLGLRISEAASLRLDAVRRDEDGTWSVLLERTKWSRADQRMPVLDETAALLLTAWLAEHRGRLLRGQRSAWLFPSSRRISEGVLGKLDVSTIRRAFQRELGLAEIEPRGRRLTPHCLRHSICTHLLAAGAAIEDVQPWMRHRSIETTRRYAHPTDRTIARMFREHDPLRGRKKQPRPMDWRKLIG